MRNFENPLYKKNYYNARDQYRSFSSAYNLMGGNSDEDEVSGRSAVSEVGKEITSYLHTPGIRAGIRPGLGGKHRYCDCSSPNKLSTHFVTVLVSVQYLSLMCMKYCAVVASLQQWKPEYMPLARIDPVPLIPDVPNIEILDDTTIATISSSTMPTTLISTSTTSLPTISTTTTGKSLPSSITSTITTQTTPSTTTAFVLKTEEANEKEYGEKKKIEAEGSVRGFPTKSTTLHDNEAGGENEKGEDVNG